MKLASEIVQNACEHGIAKNVFDHIQVLKAVAKKIAEVLPNSWLLHCQVANLRDTVLVMQVDASVWATKLHYQSPVLLEHVRKNGWPAVKTIEIFVISPDSKLLIGSSVAGEIVA